MAKQSSVNLDITTGTGSFDFPAGDGRLASASKTSTDATASRAKNTTYTNSSTDRSMHIMVTGRCAITTINGAATMQAKSDGSSPPTTAASGIVGIQNGIALEDNSFQLVFPVAPSMNYRVDTVETTGSVTIGKWFEMLF